MSAPKSEAPANNRAETYFYERHRFYLRQGAPNILACEWAQADTVERYPLKTCSRCGDVQSADMPHQCVGVHSDGYVATPEGDAP